MALSANTMRGLTRWLNGADNKEGCAVQRLVVYPESTTPVYGNHIRPTSAPSGTAAKGDFYLGSSDGKLYVHDGSNFLPPNAATSVVKTAAATLTAADNGAYCYFNSAAGDIYTLPTCAAGLRFVFVVLVTITSNAAKVITASGSEFLLGTFHQGSDGTYVPVLRSADGSTHRAWSGNGTTTGGIKGDWIEVVGISATQWAVRGHGTATGTEATPFATS